MFRLHRSKRFGAFVYRQCNTPAPKPQPIPYDPTAKVTTMDELMRRESPLLKLSQGKAKRPPFIKDLFVGKFDTRFLTFPEVLDKDQIANVTAIHDRIRGLIWNTEDSGKDNQGDGISRDLLDSLKCMGVFGQGIPSEFGGLELTVTEMVRIGEALAENQSLAAILTAHNYLGMAGLLQYGSSAQKANYFSKLASGEWIAALAFAEAKSGSDAASMETIARMSADETHYVLKGKKTYVTNGKIADVLTVFAKVDELNDTDTSKQKVTAFVIDKALPGIKITQSNYLGLRGADISEVTFDNVKIPLNSILGNKGDGFKIAQDLLNTSRCGVAVAALGVAKYAFDYTVDHVQNRVVFKKPLSEFHLTQRKIGEMAANIYAMESMLYITTAIMDVVEEPDYVLESALLRIFCTESTMKIIEDCMQLHGGSALREKSEMLQLMQDARTSAMLDGNNDNLRLLVGLTGMQYAGIHLAQAIIILRDPLRHPYTFIKKTWDRWNDHTGQPKINDEFQQFLHPSLNKQAHDLEFCVKRFQYISERTLELFGREILEQQMYVGRLSDVAMDIYGITAVLARSSRAYCIGLQNADHEIKLASSFCYDAQMRILANILELEKGMYDSNHRRLQDIAEDVYTNKGYAATHALTRNW